MTPANPRSQDDTVLIASSFPDFAALTGTMPMSQSAQNPVDAAREAERQIANAQAVFDREPDLPGARIHTLFAGLYLSTTTQWLNRLGSNKEAEFAHLVIARFFELYAQGVIAGRQIHPTRLPKHWRAYHRLAQRLTMRSSIALHLALISLGARAHTRYDLAIAVSQAAEDYQRLRGRAVDFNHTADTIIGQLSAEAFMQAALDYVAFHQQQQRGWRQLVLKFYASSLKVTTRLWLGIFQHWRHQAYGDAQLITGTARQ